MPYAHAVDMFIAAQQRSGRGVVQHRDADMLQPVMQRCDKVLSAAQDVARESAPELEFSVHLERLPAERRLEPYTLPAQP